MADPRMAALMGALGGPPEEEMAPVPEEGAMPPPGGDLEGVVSQLESMISTLPEGQQLAVEQAISIMRESMMAGDEMAPQGDPLANSAPVDVDSVGGLPI